ncbi:hypothetical protein [Nocardia sp. NPDC019302]|uniref:hypothetical protein n=1 Tax=Nocardia sp. NPDC019302 TaxID=3154592 RepID=UPI0033DC5504
MALLMSAPLATDLEEMIARLKAAAEAGDIQGALDAHMDLVSWSLGMPGVSQRLREILDQP